MRKRFAFLLILILGCIPVTSNVDSFEGKRSKFLLENGMTVVVSEMPTNPMVSVYALVKAGSATEGEFLGTGISHFLEHMLFKTTKNRKVGEIAAEIQAVGGSINAQTSFDYTMYTIDVPYESFDVALDVMADMLMNVTFEAEEVEAERTVIHSEMRLHNDNPGRQLTQATFSNVFIRHPYRHPIIGYRETFDGITREDLIKYYETQYSPSNIVFSVAGNVKTKEVKSKIEETFKDFKRRRNILRNLPEEPQQITSRRYEAEYSAALIRMSLSYSSVSLLHPDLFPLDILANIISVGRSSRLYKSIYKEKELVHSVAAYNYTPIDRGLFEIEVSMDDPEKVEETIEAIKAEIESVKKNGVTKAELEKAKRVVLSDHIFGNRTTGAVARSQAVDEGFAGDYRFSDDYVKQMGEVTNEEIIRVANQYLHDDNLTIVILRPETDQAEEDDSDANIEQAQIEKHVLDNGLTVLLKEDSTFPLVAMRVILNGGHRQEPEGQEGITRLMSSLWSKGSKAYPTEKLADLTDARGMRFGSYGGKNTYGINMECLSEDFDKGFDVISDAIFKPLFPEKELTILKDSTRRNLDQKKDNIFGYSMEELRKLLYKTHPIRKNPLGTYESLDEITQKNIIDYYNRFTTPNNMVLTVFGDINKEETLAKIKKTYGAWAKTDVELKAFSEGPLKETLQKDLELPKEQAMVLYGFQGVTIFDEDRYVVELMTSILGSSFSGRMFTNIRDKLGQAYTLGGSYAPGIDAGYIYYYVLTAEEELEKVQELLTAEIKKLQDELVPQKELDDIRTYLKGQNKADLQTNSSLAFTSTLDEIYGFGYDHYKKYDELLDKVTTEDIQRAAKQYMDLQQRAVIIIRPEEQKDGS